MRESVITSAVRLPTGRFLGALHTLPATDLGARVVREAVARAGGAGRPAAMVGDSPIDADAARAASIPFVAVSFGYSPVPASALGADAVIDRFDALAAALDGLDGVGA